MNEKNEKLVRDGIPQLAARNGDRLEIRTASTAERPSLLGAKLREESAEVVEALTTADAKPAALRMELADVLQVVHDLADLFGWSPEDLEKARQEKERERGGFRQGIVMRLATGGRT